MATAVFDQYGPCEVWPLEWTCAQVLQTASPTVTGIAARAATEALWALSGRQFGRCEVLLRPCREDCAAAPWGVPPWPGERPGWPYPALLDGAWVNLVCGGCPGSCQCGPGLSEVLLPAPAEVLEVLVGGMPLVTGAWRVYDARRLVRADGGRWPACQDLERDHTQSDTWAVRARVGRTPPQLALLAAGELACEFLRGLQGEDCRLPRQVVQLARQGVTIAMPDPAEQAKAGLVGTYFGDLFLRAYNPQGLKRRAKVYDPDRAPPARQTQPPVA